MSLWTKIPTIWQMAIKQAVSSFCAIVITNLVDPAKIVYSWPWFRHMMVAMFVLTLFNEARYWKNWADDGDPPGPQGGNMRTGRLAGTLAIVVLLFGATLGLGGCNEYKTANATITTIGQIIKVAQTDLPTICATGAITAAECTSVGQGLTGLATLQTQSSTCLTAAGASAKDAAILSCVNTFVAGLASPVELALFHVKDPKIQLQIEVWTTAVSLALNTILGVVGGSPMTPPVLADQPAPSPALHAFAIETGLARYGY